MTGPKKSRVSESPAGSPSTGEPAFLVVGKLRHSHGLKGEILMEVITDFPERLQPGVQVYLGEQHQPLHIRSRRGHAEGLLLGFEGYDVPETVRELRNQLLFVSSADRPPLPEGEYYHHQLIGLRVINDEGQELGRLVEIMSTPANDVYVVRGQGPDLLLPAVEPVVLGVDLEKGEIRVHVLPGLQD